ncbi:S-adenosylmethionine-dependent methyltransferase Rv2258c-like [Diadema setosum]|uniref:S-adenosylmethionine-dependent methyltransferase Rv2258c-like n=1 Tax=Diadema setosum TaxID=31175 RepID=UPI003B3BC91B
MDGEIRMRKAEGGSEESPREFADRMMKTVGAATVSLALSLGCETGLFNVLASQSEPISSHQLAESAGMKERYVREWLGSMVVASIIEMNPDDQTYFVPESRRPFLTNGPCNIVAFSGLVPMLCQAYDSVLSCFKEDGPKGVPYSQYPRFHSFMDHMSRKMHDNCLIQDMIPSIGGLEELLESGVSVLDLGCGQGHATMLMAQRFPDSTFYGLDISQEAIGEARAEASRLSLTNCRFMVQDASSLPDTWSNTFHLVTFYDAFHDMPRPETVLRETQRVMVDDGILMMMEVNVHSSPHKNIGNPRAIDGYVISMLHCTPVSMFFDGPGLGTMWGKENASEMLKQHGFGDITMKPSKDRFNVVITGKKKKD